MAAVEHHGRWFGFIMGVLHFQYGFYSGNVIVDGEAKGHVG